MGAAVAQEVAKLVIGETIEAAKQDTTEEKSWEAGTQYSISEGKTHDHVQNAMKGANVELPQGMTEHEWMSAIETGVKSGYDEAQLDVDKYATNRPEGS
jgi:hypothetical protein